MKKGLLVSMFLGLFVVSAFAATPIKVSLVGGLGLPVSEEVVGLDLGLLGAKTAKVTGIQLSYIYSRAEEINGLQLGIVTSTDDGAGIQYGFVNNAKTFKGVQLGFVNRTDKMTGLQWGFWNRTNSMEKGVQIGLINLIKDSSVPFMVIANAKF